MLTEIFVFILLILAGVLLVAFNILSINRLLLHRKRGAACTSCRFYGACPDCNRAPESFD